ncbi:hypothetical protein ACFX15_007829 [Malus domestica]
MITAAVIYVPISINLSLSNCTICIKQVPCYFHLTGTVCLLNRLSNSTFFCPVPKSVTVIALRFPLIPTFTIMKL